MRTITRQEISKPRKADADHITRKVLADHPEILREIETLRNFEQRNWENETTVKILDENPTIPQNVARYAAQRSRLAHTAAERAKETQRILAYFG